MAARRPLDPAAELLEELDHSLRVTEYLLGTLPAGLWSRTPPTGGRTLGAIVAHMQSLRRGFAHLGAEAAPPALDRARVTPAGAKKALRASRVALVRLFRGALGSGEARVRKMPRRAVNTMVYLIQHEAHHRGQISLLARAMGHAPTRDQVLRIWGWKKLDPP